LPAISRAAAVALAAAVVFAAAVVLAAAVVFGAVVRLPKNTLVPTKNRNCFNFKAF